MKKTILFLLAAVLIAACLPMSVSANSYTVGEEVGEVYSTDIMAYVNGHPIPSYNIGGKTCICVEDLAYYGFDIYYDNDTRTLTVNAYLDEDLYIYDNLERGELGEVPGYVYYTDIVTYINGVEIENTYNIGGKTCVCIEDIGDLTDSPYEEQGYSECSMFYVWDSEERTISLYALIPALSSETEEEPSEPSDEYYSALEEIKALSDFTINYYYETDDCALLLGTNDDGTLSLYLVYTADGTVLDLMTEMLDEDDYLKYDMAEISPIEISRDETTFSITFKYLSNNYVDTYTVDLPTGTWTEL